MKIQIRLGWPFKMFSSRVGHKHKDRAAVMSRRDLYEIRRTMLRKLQQRYQAENRDILMKHP